MITNDKGEVNSMPAYNCKSCGAPLHIIEGESIVKCPYCGLEQTLPLLDAEVSSRMFARASDYLKDGNFDAAQKIFESYLITNEEDYHPWWGLMQCLTQNWTAVLTDTTTLDHYFVRVKQYASKEIFSSVQPIYVQYLRTACQTLSSQLRQDCAERQATLRLHIQALEEEKRLLMQSAEHQATTFHAEEEQINKQVSSYNSKSAFRIVVGYYGLLLSLCLFLAVGIIQDCISFTPQQNTVFLSIGLSFSTLCFLVSLFLFNKEDNEDVGINGKISSLQRKQTQLQKSQKQSDQRIQQITLELEQLNHLAERLSLAESFNDQEIADTIFMEKSRSFLAHEPASSKFHKFFTAVEFCPVCGTAHKSDCSYCGANCMHACDITSFLMQIENMEDVEEIHRFMMEYLDKQPDSIDPRIVEIVKKQLKIERSYGNAKKDTIRKIMELE